MGPRPDILSPDELAIGRPLHGSGWAGNLLPVHPAVFEAYRQIIRRYPVTIERIGGKGPHKTALAAACSATARSVVPAASRLLRSPGRPAAARPRACGPVRRRSAGGCGAPAVARPPLREFRSEASAVSGELN